MSVISEEMNVLNADGVDFVSFGFHLENGEPIGEIYESYSKEEFTKKLVIQEVIEYIGTEVKTIKNIFVKI